MHRARISLLALASLTALVVGCESKSQPEQKTAAPGEATPAGEKPASEPSTGPSVDVAALAARIGVEPGGWEPEAGVAPEGVITAEREGTVEIRRVGQEMFAAATGSEPVSLYAGDQVRTGDNSKAVIALVDETAIELAELTAVAVGDRDASADPASSAAVLYGVARFSVSPRSAGEGPFLAYTAGAIVGTKGTVYAVGVSASGEARVGVEEGEIEVAGTAALDEPVALVAGKAATVAADGTVAAPEPFVTDDWGTWRDETDATVKPAAAVSVHVEALAELELETDKAYIELEGLTQDAGEVEAAAEVAAQAGDSAAYEASEAERTATIEASFLASVQLQQQTYAMLSHAYLAHELYVRHPDTTRTAYVVAAPRISGALLYHKKYHAVVNQHVRPLRAAYYVHHPVGRMHAAAAAQPVPAFYARATLEPVDAAVLGAKLSGDVYQPPVPEVQATGKTVRVHAPAVDWYGKVKIKPARPRQAGWYVRPATPRARVVTGVAVTAPDRPVFTVRTRGPKGKAAIKWGGAGARVRGKGRAGAAIEAGAGVDVRDHRGANVVVPGVAVDEAVDAVGGVDVNIRDHRGATGKANAKTNAKTQAKANAKANIGGAVDIGNDVRDHRGSGVKVKGGVGGKIGVDVKPRDHRKGAVKVEEKARDHRTGATLKGGVEIKGGAKLGLPPPRN